MNVLHDDGVLYGVDKGVHLSFALKVLLLRNNVKYIW